MADLTDAEIDVALDLGRIAAETEPRAASARYDRALGRVIVDLTNGCTFAFPPHIAEGLETATADELSQIEILGAGYGLRWTALDSDLSIPGLLAGVFGTRSHMARRAGMAAGPAKAATGRVKGAKSGRLRKNVTR